MRIRNYKREDFPILQNWFKQWEWDECDPETIPVNSFFVEVDGSPVVFSCFLATDCNMALMGITLSDRQYKDKTPAVDFVLAHLLTQCKEKGYKYLNYYTNTPYMVQRMKKQGLKVTNHGKTWVLVGSLGGERTKFFEE